jgi:NAD(P)-dependent dehydrogenase (short-subunit alcohol dehydrogenase family)
MSAVPPSERVLDGLVAIVTGAANGIGRAIATEFAANGACVMAADVDAPGAEAVAAGLGGSARGVGVDVTKPEEVAAAVDAAVDAWGRLDVVVNNAGVFHLGSVLDCDVDTWRRVFAVNVDGTYAMAREAVRVMLDQPPHPATGVRGRIVNVSSGSADTGRPFFPAYGASKAAVNHLSKSLAAAYGDRLVATTVLYPGNVREGMWRDLGPRIAEVEGRPVEEVVGERWFQPADHVAHAAVYIAASRGLDLNGMVVSYTPRPTPL